MDFSWGLPTLWVVLWLEQVLLAELEQLVEQDGLGMLAWQLAGLVHRLAELVHRLVELEHRLAELEQEDSLVQLARQHMSVELYKRVVQLEQLAGQVRIQATQVAGLSMAVVLGQGQEEVGPMV